MLSLQYKFGAPAVAPPPSTPMPACDLVMVFFDWDRSNLSQQALATIGQAAQAFKTKGSARITATGHTDTSGPENYNMALSLRRANAVKDALVQNGRAGHGDCGRRPRRAGPAGPDDRTVSASRRTAASRSCCSKTLRQAKIKKGRPTVAALLLTSRCRE